MPKKSTQTIDQKEKNFLTESEMKKFLEAANSQSKAANCGQSGRGSGKEKIIRMQVSNHLFLSERGPMTRQSIKYLVEESGKRAKLNFKINPHICGIRPAII